MATTKHFKQFHYIDTFKAREDIGGLWNYTIISELTHPDLNNDEYYKLYGNLNPSIYENMTVNLPKYLMLLKGYPASKTYSLIMKPEEYHEYLKEYSDHFELNKQIKLNSLVWYVKLLRSMNEEQFLEFTPQQRKRKFTITIKNTKTRELSKETYDHIVCWNGRNSKKYIPLFKGKEDWDGEQLYMHEFRTIDKSFYEDKNILVVGSGISLMITSTI